MRWFILHLPTYSIKWMNHHDHESLFFVFMSMPFAIYFNRNHFLCKVWFVLEQPKHWTKVDLTARGVHTFAEVILIYIYMYCICICICEVHVTCYHTWYILLSSTIHLTNKHDLKITPNRTSSLVPNLGVSGRFIFILRRPGLVPVAGVWPVKRPKVQGKSSVQWRRTGTHSLKESKVSRKPMNTHGHPSLRRTHGHPSLWGSCHPTSMLEE